MDWHEIRHRQRFIYKTKRRKGSRTVIIGGKRHREQHRIPGKFIYKTKRRKGSRTVIIGGKRHREQHRIPGNRVRSESYLGPRGGLALKFSWATHDF
ncbi:hypothetical protein SRHO_G00343550 [Serrasalmus rhombeus]